MDGERGEPCVEGERYLMRADGEKRRKNRKFRETRVLLSLFVAKKKQPKKTKKTIKNFKGHNLTKLNQA